jgi:hypothetical protein
MCCFDLLLKLGDELQFIVSDVVLLFEFVILVLQTPDSHFEQLVLPLCLEGSTVVKLSLVLLGVELALPALDLISELFFVLLLLVCFFSQS